MATAGRTTKLDDDFTVSAIGFGAGALASVYDVVSRHCLGVRFTGRLQRCHGM
jgi:hypothetical protein